MTRQTYRYGFFALLSAVLWWSCETEFIPDINSADPDIVVEGYIEAGESANPPYVFLTRTVPFFSEFNADDIADTYVHGATVIVNDGVQDYPLTEVCLNDLPEELRDQVSAFFGLNPDSVGVNVCAYLDLSFTLIGQAGREYSLRIEAEGKTLSARTRIPEFVPIDSLRFSFRNVNAGDSIFQLTGFLNDPAAAVNSYSYRLSINGGQFLKNEQSVVRDDLFDGKAFEFPMPRPSEATEEFDPARTGFYVGGDTLSIRWLNIGPEQFDFWNTLEYNANNQGPFASSYSRVLDNVEGGLGIWGGQSVGFYEAIVGP